MSEKFPKERLIEAGHRLGKAYNLDVNNALSVSIKYDANKDMRTLVVEYLLEANVLTAALEAAATEKEAGNG